MSIPSKVNAGAAILVGSATLLNLINATEQFKAILTDPMNSEPVELISFVSSSPTSAHIQVFKTNESYWVTEERLVERIRSIPDHVQVYLVSDSV